MCNYVNENKCKITGDICPYMYYCEKIRAFRASSAMPKECKIVVRKDVPKGYSIVRDERNGYLYVDYGEITIKLKNPYSIVPNYVKIRRDGTDFKIVEKG